MSVDLEAVGRELGCLEDWEYLEGRTTWAGFQ